jgi:tetratricopeptide (TPR) repeat protein
MMFTKNLNIKTESDHDTVDFMDSDFTSLARYTSSVSKICAVPESPAHDLGKATGDCKGPKKFRSTDHLQSTSTAAEKDTLERGDMPLESLFPSTLTSWSNLALAFYNRGQYDRAMSINQQVLRWRTQELGPGHPDTLTSLSNLAVGLDNQGKHHVAEEMNRQAWAARQRVLGPEHVETLLSMNNLALVLNHRGRFEEAEALHRHTLTQRTQQLGPRHPDSLMSMSNLAGTLNSQGKHGEAERMDRQVLKARAKVLGLKHPDTLTSMNNLAVVLDYSGTRKEAEALSRSTLAYRCQVLGKSHPDTILSTNNLIGLLHRRGKHEEADALSRRVLVLKHGIPEAVHSDMTMRTKKLAREPSVLCKSAKQQSDYIRQKIAADLGQTTMAWRRISDLFAFRRTCIERLYERAYVAILSMQGKHDTFSVTSGAQQMLYVSRPHEKLPYEEIS